MSLYITADIEYRGKHANVELPVTRMYFDLCLSAKLGIHSFDELNSDQVVVRNFEGFKPIKNWKLSYAAANHLVATLDELPDIYLNHAAELIAAFYDGDLWDFVYNVSYGAVTFEDSIDDLSDLALFLLDDDELVDYEMWYRYVDWHKLVNDYPDLCPNISDERERGIAISHQLGDFTSDLHDYTDLERMGAALKSYVVDCVFTDDGCFYKTKGEV